MTLAMDISATPISPLKHSPIASEDSHALAALTQPSQNLTLRFLLIDNVYLL